MLDMIKRANKVCTARYFGIPECSAQAECQIVTSIRGIWFAESYSKCIQLYCQAFERHTIA